MIFSYGPFPSRVSRGLLGIPFPSAAEANVPSQLTRSFTGFPVHNTLILSPLLVELRSVPFSLRVLFHPPLAHPSQTFRVPTPPQDFSFLGLSQTNDSSLHPMKTLI